MTEDNGLIYMRARYYSPELRRFINADKLHGDISNAVTLNRYAFANCNPVANIDPLGLSSERGNTQTIRVSQPMANNIVYEEVEAMNSAYNGITWFNSSDDAAYDFAMKYNVKSIEIKRELGAIIVSKMMYLYMDNWYTITELVALHKSGNIPSMSDFFRNPNFTKKEFFTYVAPSEAEFSDETAAYGKYQVGRYKGIDMVESRKYGKVVAYIHTHGNYDPLYDSNVFSPKDKKYVQERNVMSYLATPLGELNMYNPFTDEVIPVDSHIPCDPHYLRD